MSCGVGHRHSSDPTLLWLWQRLAAVATIRPLAWETPYAMTAALKRQKTGKTNKQKNPKTVRAKGGIKSHPIQLLHLIVGTI